MAIHYHNGDLPSGLSLGKLVAVDTEAMGLDFHRDQLCVIQLSDGGEDQHVVKLDRSTFECPILKALLADTSVEKIFHFARFDVAMMKNWLGIECAPIFCTKIASKLARTYTDRHGLKDVTRELVGADMSKAQQSSDWGADELSEAQLAYAASDVLYLHEIREKLITMLEREGRLEMAKACFEFLPKRADLDLAGWPETDIFAHS